MVQAVFGALGLHHRFSKKCLQKNYGSVSIATTIEPPSGDFLTEKLSGAKYNLGSGPILLLDRRTIKIYGFSFEGDKAPGNAQISRT